MLEKQILKGERKRENRYLKIILASWFKQERVFEQSKKRDKAEVDFGRIELSVKPLLHLFACLLT